ncbi:MAG: 5-formyltetrahydrofolate cyclo-ligase [Planctomycetes bacterium]|nr:5-formyltetrahydrofolate cyclo-ligase [Planctomycetota bacterium]
MAQNDDEIFRRKTAMRQMARERRAAQGDKDLASRRIGRQLIDSAEYARAETVLFYVDADSEVRTRETIEATWARGKRVAVPYCVGNELRLFPLEDWSELAPGIFGILEPRQALRDVAGKRLDTAELDLIVVPGLAFDRCGGRLGQGKGYYDRLLSDAPSHTAAVGVAFQCQLLPEVPMQPHDVFLDQVITEETVHQGKGRAQRS